MSSKSQSEAGFMKGMGVQAQQCGECANFVPGGGSCTIINGVVEANDICNLFELASMVGDMSALFAKAKTFDMFITKATQDPETGERRWAAVASDTDLDSYNDRMSLELYRDFINRAEEEELPPAVFVSEAWQGGMPYLGLSHYLDLNGEGIAGVAQALYVDGNRLKAKGTFSDNALGAAAFKAIKRDKDTKVDSDERIRISIAFVDWGHDHGEKPFVREALEDSCPMCAEGMDDKIYKKGHLVHLALTRVPVNERTPVWLEERSMTTIKDDALSVLGEDEEELVNHIDELAQGKSEIFRSEGVVIKSEEDEADAPTEAIVERMLGGATTFAEAETYVQQSEEVSEVVDYFYMLDSILFNIQWDSEIKDKPAAMSVAVNEFKSRVDSSVKRSLAVRAASLLVESEAEEGEPMTKETEVIEEKAEVKVIEPAVEETPLDAALSQLKSVVMETSLVDASVEDRFAAIQPIFDNLAGVVKSTVKGEKVIEAEAVGSAVAEAIRSELAPLAEAIQLLAQKSSVPAPKAETPLIPGPRAYSHPPAHLKAEDKPKSALTSMIRKSVGLSE